MTTFIDLAEVKEYGGIEDDGTVISPARLQTLGSTPGMSTAKLYRWTPTGDGMAGQWEEWDHLQSATTTNNDDGSVTVTGQSEKLANEVGLRGQDAEVRWEVKPRGMFRLPMSWFLFFLGALVVYRVTRFFIEDSMFEVTRARFMMWLAGPPPQGVFSIPIGEELPEPPKPVRTHVLRRKLADLAVCPYCMSFWLAVGWTVIQDWRYDVTLPLLYPFALAAGSLAAWRYIERN